ncbi:tubulin-folding cofactor C [Selaginella moellendorffii]|nr:tubulin-folding cofactor C [Selaginella moellendorffii]XP_024515348.1 tubulin-folding cofactor C [Selaginella moellendorffii]|eukprot:XP_002985749.2 tubulin-folding cofactor C [Selaginella moellendorffii]
MEAKDGRYAAMLERLAALDSERARQAEARRHDAAASANPLESTGAFQGAFDEQRKIVEESLSRIRQSGSASGKADMDAVAIQLAAMDKMVSDASYFLPPYDVQSSRSVVDRLKQSLESAIAEVIPKKKFSFRAKNTSSSPKETVTPPAVKNEEEEDETPSFMPDRAANLHSIRDAKNSTIVHDSGESSETEVTLSNLTHCTVFLRGIFRAMFFHKLKNCHVYVSAVTGSILLEEIDSCIFMLASHQIRIHSTTNTDFYLRVRSRPIVEHVSGVRFAPYAFHYQGIEDHLKAANLAEETGLWEKVDDFRWLRAAASPNWSILRPDQRVPLVDGTNVSSREFCNK